MYTDTAALIYNEQYLRLFTCLVRRVNFSFFEEYSQLYMVTRPQLLVNFEKFPENECIRRMHEARARCEG